MLNNILRSQILTKDPSFPVDQIARIIEKMQKHSKVEDAAIKLVRDLEMQIKALHNSYVVSLTSIIFAIRMGQLSNSQRSRMGTKALNKSV